MGLKPFFPHQSLLFASNSFYSFSPLIVACEAATNCSGHGSCRADGTCECDSQFFSADCASKLEGFHFIFSDLGFDTLTFQFH